MSAEPEILYEDRDLIVCHKPAGVAVQSARPGQIDLESMLKNREALLHPQKMPYLGVVHRLDQPVEGIVVFGKNKKAAAVLSAQAASDVMSKEYLAVVEGIVKAEEETELVHFLLKEKNVAKVTGEKDPRGKRAVLTYRVIRQNEERSLLNVKLQTGRFHQIRCQLSAMGHPICGDSKYGAAPGMKNGCIALFAVSLTFTHPSSKKRMSFSLPLESRIQNDYNV